MASDTFSEDDSHIINTNNMNLSEYEMIDAHECKEEITNESEILNSIDSSGEY
jgi:hypothetical protein